eukprot:gene1412-1564_t
MPSVETERRRRFGSTGDEQKCSKEASRPADVGERASKNNRRSIIKRTIGNVGAWKYGKRIVVRVVASKSIWVRTPLRLKSPGTETLGTL